MLIKLHTKRIKRGDFASLVIVTDNYYAQLCEFTTKISGNIHKNVEIKLETLQQISKRVAA